VNETQCEEILKRHFNGSGVNVPFMYVSTRRAMSHWLIGEYEKRVYGILHFICILRNLLWGEGSRSRITVNQGRLIQQEQQVNGTNHTPLLAAGCIDAVRHYNRFTLFF